MEVVPVHGGSMALSIKSLLQEYEDPCWILRSHRKIQALLVCAFNLNTVELEKSLSLDFNGRPG